MRFNATAIIAAAFALVSVVPLRATTIQSFTVSDWLNSTSGGVTDVNFSGINFTDYSATGFATDGFTITGPDSGTGSLTGISFNGFKSLKGGSDASSLVKIDTPAAGNTALLFVFGSDPSGNGYTLTLSDGEVFNLASSATMFGISVSHPITSATFSTTSGSSFVLQGMSYGITNLALDAPGGGPDPGPVDPGPGDPSAVPEAGTTLLMGGGLLMVALVLRRTKTA
jgi:hypothetical protein